MLSPWPVDEPTDWLALVNRPQTAAKLGLQWTPRPRGGQKREISGE